MVSPFADVQHPLRSRIPFVILYYIASSGPDAWKEKMDPIAFEDARANAAGNSDNIQARGTQMNL